MKLAVFGATGGTGRHLVSFALERGHAVTALVREPEKAQLPEGITIVQGDVRDPVRVAEVIAGREAVLSCLGAALAASHGSRGKVGADAAPAIVSGMNQHGVKRLVALSALGACEGKPQMSFFFRVIMATVLRGIYADKNAMEPLIRATDLDWTIVRPTNLKDGARTGELDLDPTSKIGITSTINRADVADFMLQIVTDPQYTRRVVTITHGA